MNEMQQMQQDAQYFLDQVIKNNNLKEVKIVFTEELLNDGRYKGDYLNGEIGRITICYPAFDVTAELFGIDKELAVMLSVIHEFGHHLCGHKPLKGMSKGDRLIMEYEAWINGRTIAKLVEQHNPGFLKLYDHDNKNNIREYILFEFSNDPVTGEKCLNYFMREMNLEIEGGNE